MTLRRIPYPVLDSARTASRRLADLGAGLPARLNMARWSIATRLAAIVFALAVPLNIVIIAVIWHLAGAASETQRAGLLYTARSVTAALDAELGRYKALAEALSRSPGLLEDNLDKFEAEARRTFETDPGAWIIVADLDGRQILNLAAPHGHPLPSRVPAGLAAQRLAFGKRAAVVSDVIFDPVARTWVATIEVPVFKDGKPFRALAVTMRLQAFLALFNAQKMPAHWLAGIIDSHGRFIARVPDNDKFVGQLSSEGWLEIDDLEGVFNFTSPEGRSVTHGNAHSRLSGWIVGIAVTKAQIQSAAWSTVRWALFLGSGLSALSLVFAGAMARSIARPIAELGEKATGLLTNPSISIAPGPPEVTELWSTLQRAALDRNRAERDLRSSEARHRQLANSMPQLVWTARPDGQLEYWNSRISAFAGAYRDEKGQWHWKRMIHEPDLSATLEAWGRAFAAGTEYEFAHRLRMADGSTRWHLSRAVPVRNEAGRVLRWYGTATDIHDLRMAEEQLRRSYTTYLSLIENAPLGVYLVDSKFRLAQASKGARETFKNVHPLIGRDFGEVVCTIWPEPFASQTIERFRHTLETGESYHSTDTTEQRRDVDDVQSYDWQIERVALPDGSDGVVCYFYDLTERRRQEEHIRFLMHELNHRAKNLLGVVQAIARQTAAANPMEFASRFGERVQALSANQDLLIAQEWRGVNMHDLARAQLAHFSDLIGTRIRIDGPKLMVNAAAAQAIGMALHELATNAGKYGALSNEQGSLDVSWRVDDASFSVSWLERGGPPVEPPSRRGFGTTVVESMAGMGVGGKVELNYPPSGITWRLECPARNCLV